MSVLRQRMIEDMQLRNLAPNTQISYIQQVSCFARHFGKCPTELGEEEIRAYQVYLLARRSWLLVRYTSPSQRFASCTG